MVALCVVAVMFLTQCGKTGEAPAPAEKAAKVEPAKDPAPQAQPITLPQPPAAKRAPTKDEELVYSALNFNFPGLEPVAAAIKAGDYDAATAAFGKYLRGRQGFNWYAPDQKYKKDIAERAARGEVTGGQVPYFYAFPNGDINWWFNATKDNPKQAFNNEWQWQLNRMWFWNEMARAYLNEKDEKYAKAWVKQFRSWVEQCPVPSELQNKSNSTWRTIEAGLRMGYSWPDGFFAFVNSPSITDTDLLMFYRSILDHCRFLRSHPTELNWLLMEMNGLATIGCFFPEFQEAPDWRSFAFATLEVEAKKQFLPDGAQFEISTGYHSDVALNNFLRTAAMAQKARRDKELPATFIALLERGFDWVLYLTTPDLDRPKINDSWPGNSPNLFKRALPFFPNRQDYLWLSSKREEGKAPEKVSVFLDWSGIAAMRSGWGESDNLLVFRVGPLGYGGFMGYGHAHQDKLNVCIWAHGRELLYDCGGGSYENSRWRQWARSSYSHNCIIVDGLSQYGGDPKAKDGQITIPSHVSQKPIDAGWKSTPVYDFAMGTYDDSYGNKEWGGDSIRVKLVSQRRSVLFLKPDIYIVSDIVTPLDDKPHQLQARWQLKTTRSEVDSATKAAQTMDENMPNLAIVPIWTEGLTAIASVAQQAPEILGWNVRKDMDPQLVPATTLIHTKQGSGIQRFLTLLIPLKAGESNPVSKVSGANPAHVEFKDGRKFEISANDDGAIKVKETLPDGKAGRVAP